MTETKLVYTESPSVMTDLREVEALVERLARAAGMRGLAVGSREAPEAVEDEVATERLAKEDILTALRALVAERDELRRDFDVIARREGKALHAIFKDAEWRAQVESLTVQRDELRASAADAERAAHTYRRQAETLTDQLAAARVVLAAIADYGWANDGKVSFTVNVASREDTQALVAQLDATPTPDGYCVTVRDYDTMHTEDMHLIEKTELTLLREIAHRLAQCWLYGNWKAETTNERDIEAAMRTLGWWPIPGETLIDQERWLSNRAERVMKI